MRKKFKSLAFLICICFSRYYLSGQNLVLNGNFEAGWIPTLEGQINAASNWEKKPTFCGAPGASSPDLFDRNSTNCRLDIPTNKWAINIDSRVPGHNRYLGFTQNEDSRAVLAPFPTGCFDYSLSFWYHTIDGYPSDASNCNVGNIVGFGASTLIVKLVNSNNCNSHTIANITLSESSNWQNYSLNFSLLNIQNYNRLEFQIVNQVSGRSSVIFLDDVELRVQPLTPMVNGPSSICSNQPLTFAGSVVQGYPNNHFWEILEWDPTNNIPVANGFVWSQWYPGAPQSSYTFPSNINVPCNKFYKVKLALQNNCVVWSEANIVFNYKCSPYANAGPDYNIVCGNCVTIGTNNGPIKNTQFTWYGPGNNVIGSGQQITVCPSPPGGLYTLVVSSSNGCYNSDQVMVNVSCAKQNMTEVAENKIEKDKYLLMYPNPSNGKFEILNSLSENISFQICDIHGRLIKAGILSNEKTEVDLSIYDKGIYFIKSTVNGKTEVKKIIVQ